MDVVPKPCEAGNAAGTAADTLAGTAVGTTADEMRIRSSIAEGIALSDL